MKTIGQSLNKIVERLPHLQPVYKHDLEFGDLVLIQTCNSTYVVRVLSDGFYSVSGGWFDARGLSPMRTRILGCTWGGSIIKVDVLAACGLCLEFANRVVTSPIRQVTLYRVSQQN